MIVLSLFRNFFLMFQNWSTTDWDVKFWYLSHLIIVVILFCLLCALILFQVDNCRLLRELKDSYKKQYGREYRDEPSQIMNFVRQVYSFIRRLFSLLSQLIKKR